MRRIRITLTLALAFGGCSLVYDPGVHTGGGMDAGGDVDAGPIGIALEEFCPTIADYFCDAVERCCMGGTPPMSYDRSTCVDNATVGCSNIYGATARSQLDYDPVAALATLEAGRAYLTSCSLEITDWYLRRDGFYGGIVGTIAAGELCTPRDEEDQTEVIVAILSCVEGHVCQRLMRGTWRCFSPGAPGASCTLASDCATGRCTRDGVRLGVCSDPGESAGSPCITSHECISIYCMRTGAFTGECAAQSVDGAYCPSTLD